MEAASAVRRPPADKVRHFLFNQRGLRSGWRLAIFAVLLAVVEFCAIGMVRILISVAWGAGLWGRALPLWWSLMQFAQFASVVVSTRIMSRIERRSPEIYGLPIKDTAFPRFAVGWLLWGFLPLTVILVIMRGLGVFYFGGLAVHGSDVLYWASAWGLMYLAVGLYEEYLFRGYALHTLAEGVGFWPAAVILGIAFAASHLWNGGENRIGIVHVFVFALFAAATLRGTGDLWLAVGAHTGWDWGESFFYGVGDSGYLAPGHLLASRIQGPDWLSGGSVGPEGSVVALIVLAVMTLLAFFLYPLPKQSRANQ